MSYKFGHIVFFLYLYIQFKKSTYNKLKQEIMRTVKYSIKQNLSTFNMFNASVVDLLTGKEYHCSGTKERMREWVKEMKIWIKENNA